MSRRFWSSALTLALLVGCAGELSTPGEPLRLLAPALPVAYEQEPYEATLRPTGGLRPYDFAVVDGALPPGLRLEAGRLVGTPTNQGRFSFTVELRDANLNRTIQPLDVTVRELPEPVVGIDVPHTELQRATELRLRLESGRGWRGAEVLVTWNADAFMLEPESVRTAGRDVIAVWETGPGRLRVDVAALGDPLARATDLVRFTLAPVEPQRLGLTLRAASVAAAGRSLSTRRLGAPVDITRPADEPVPEEPAPPEPPLEGSSSDEPSSDEPSSDEPSSDEPSSDEPPGVASDDEPDEQREVEPDDELEGQAAVDADDEPEEAP